MNKQAKKLEKENWRLCHEIVDIRDGHVCMIPGCGETEYLDLDHAISRMCKTTYFETDILGYLCKRHHQHKSFRKGQWVDLMVIDITVKRIGQARWEDLQSFSRQNCGEFGNISYQEKQNEMLKAELEGVKNEIKTQATNFQVVREREETIEKY